MLLADLGHISLISAPTNYSKHPENGPNSGSLLSSSTGMPGVYFDETEMKYYDRFEFALTNLQLVMIKYNKVRL